MAVTISSPLFLDQTDVLYSRFPNDSSTQLVNDIQTEGPSLNPPKSTSQGLVSDEVRLIVQAITFTAICLIMAMIGTVTNIINVICFKKQGFKDPVIITFLGLAISDLGCLVTLISMDLMNLCFNPLFYQADLPFDYMDVQYLTGGWPHVIFTRVTSWITAIITFERCLCITLPLKVKTMITSKRVTVAIVCVFIILTASVSPVYYANRLVWKFCPGRNKTMLGLVYTSDRESVERVSYAINNLLTPFSAFFVVIICTVVLVIKLRQKTKWRQKSTGPDKSTVFSHRDQRVTNMVVMISFLFIVCFIPVCIIFIGMTVEPEFSIDGQYRNLFLMVSSIGFIMESTNSSLNIFIYYHMSSKYRSVFRELFGLSPKDKQCLDAERNTKYNLE